ncbi:hypothetical protein FACS189451_06890 [Bacteroidia bacterium]|nr:hypothetical protein FACS189451_06890 [Bacteroidia bacterium]
MIKKFTLLVATFLMVAFGVSAQTQLNNPKDADGYSIVKWNCANETWADANDFEVDQNFVLAVDVTGTPFEDWLKATPTAAGATRSLAINKWSGFGGLNGDSHRLKQIKGNIYGATWNIAQLGAADFEIATATTAGEQCYVFGQLFGFEYTADSPGAGWWMWPVGVPEAALIAGPGDAFFRTAPYTGTKTSDEFWNDEYPGLFETAYGSVKGYGPACAVPTGIKTVGTSVSPVVGHEYYNFQGQKLSKAPESGLFIDKAIKADGTSESAKVFKPLK